MKPFQRHTLVLALVLILCTLGIALLMNRQHAESITALRAAQSEVVAELRLLRASTLTPPQVREAVMHGTVDADEERKRRANEEAARIETYRTQPAGTDDAVQRALRMARGDAAR